MATRKQQKIRAQKREKRSKSKARSNRRASAREPIHIMVERAADALRPHPALAGARFDRELLRAELTLLDEWAARQVALADGLERLAGAVDLAQILHAVYTRLITDPILRGVSRSLKQISVSGGAPARSADTLGAMLIGHAEEGVPPAHNPLWRKILQWSLEEVTDLEPRLRARARWFFAGPPDLSLPPLPEGFLRTRYPVDQKTWEALLDQVQAPVRLEVGVGELYGLLRAFAKLAVLREGLEPDEVSQLFGPLLLAATRQLPHFVKARFRDAFPGTAQHEDLALAMAFGEYGLDGLVSAGFLDQLLMDPDSPDLALNLARDLRESNPDSAEVLCGWAAETYPELFDAHAELAELAREKGDWERARKHAQGCLDALEGQSREALDDEIRAEFEQLAKSILATSTPFMQAMGADS